MAPLLLHIESATDICSIALSKGEQVIGFSETTEAFQHASRMTLLIEATMQEAGHTLSDLDAVSVSQGPGSYTSLRVGFSTAKGICYALDKPLIAVSTLAALARAMERGVGSQKSEIRSRKSEVQSRKIEEIASSISAEASSPIYYLPMIDARRMEVYTAYYDDQLAEVKAPYPLIVTADSFEEELSEGVHLVLAGSGAPKCKTILEHKQMHWVEVLCSARHLVPLALQAFEQKQFVDVAYTAPFYLKAPNITISKKRLL